jgi:formylglycine-generating enzyme required for sulfatase activity
MKKPKIGLIFILLLLIAGLLIAIMYTTELLPSLDELGINLPSKDTSTPTLTSTPLPDFAATLAVQATETQKVVSEATQTASFILTEEAGVAQTAIAAETQAQVENDIATAIVIVTQVAQSTQYAYETEVAFALALETEKANATQTQMVQLTQEAYVTPTPTLDITVRSIDNMEMVYVPAGIFSMGAREDDDPARDDEKPVHSVFLDAYYIDRFEVTSSQFAKYLNANPTAIRWVPSNSVSNIQKVDGLWQAKPGFEDHPVANIIWAGAVNYCNWVGGDLPTEAQWEKAARGTDERRYPWGNEFKSVPIRLNFDDSEYSFMDDGYVKTAPVGIYPDGMSPYGAMDMAGNLWEWTADWYANIYKKQADVITYNPTGAIGGDGHVYRGGSYNSSFLDFRTTERRLSDDPRADLGFRCVINP